MMKAEKVMTHELDQIASIDISSNLINHTSKERNVCAHACLGHLKHMKLTHTTHQQFREMRHKVGSQVHGRKIFQM